MRIELRELQHRLGITSVYVTHDLEEALAMSDRIVVMRDGLIEQIGSPMEIYSDPVSYFVADFFGSPSMNLVAGEIVQADGALRFRSHAFNVALPPAFAKAPLGKATLGVRPEHVGVKIGGAEGADRLPIRLVEPLGKDTLLYFEDGSERAFVAVSEGLEMAEVKAGTLVSLTFNPSRLYLFATDGKRLRGA
jgi:multiple sugar transport system ATP-binding protein